MKSYFVCILTALASNAFAATPVLVSGDSPLAITCTDAAGVVTNTNAKFLRILNGSAIAVEDVTSGGEELVKILGDNCVIQPNLIIQPAHLGEM